MKIEGSLSDPEEGEVPDRLEAAVVEEERLSLRIPPRGAEDRLTPPGIVRQIEGDSGLISLFMPLCLRRPSYQDMRKKRQDKEGRSII